MAWLFHPPALARNSIERFLDPNNKEKVSVAGRSDVFVVVPQGENP